MSIIKKRQAPKPTAREAFDEAVKAHQRVERYQKILAAAVEVHCGGSVRLDIDRINATRADAIVIRQDGDALVIESPGFIRALRAMELANYTPSRWERFKAWLAHVLGR